MSHVFACCFRAAALTNRLNNEHTSVSAEIKPKPCVRACVRACLCVFMSLCDALERPHHTG